jgi:hypothetical protein
LSLALILSREYRPYCTMGVLTLPSGATVRTLERPWISNRTNISCIPEGAYSSEWLERSASGKYKRVWHLSNVESRTGILIHSGNYVRHSTGCILVGLKRGIMGGQEAVLSSRSALNLMRSELEGKDFTLIVE